MIKIEVITRKQMGDLGVEREYRAELPDTATAEQIAAVSMEGANVTVNAGAQAEDEPMGGQGTWTKPVPVK